MFVMRVYIFVFTACVLLVCLYSYPYSEDSSQGKQYMNTRCPAWCDRILLSASARDLVLKVSLMPATFDPIQGLLIDFKSQIPSYFGQNVSTPPSTEITLYFHNSIVLDPHYPPRSLSLHRWKDEVSVNINLER